MNQTPLGSDPQARIRRLRKAIGDINAASFNTDHHIHTILEMLKDKQALAILEAEE